MLAIVGDSWGEPNWRGPELSDFTALGHSEHRLRAQGYCVQNYSRSGGSNLQSWLALDRDQINPDWIIWFHTEISRDLHSEQGTLARQLDAASQRVYARINDIWQKTQSRLIVIEAQSQRHWNFDHYFNNYVLIADWRRTLLNCAALPYTPLLAQISNGSDFIHRFTDSVWTKNQWISDAERVMSMMQASAYFPDNCHPSDSAHQQLCLELTMIIESSTLTF